MAVHVEEGQEHQARTVEKGALEVVPIADEGAAYGADTVVQFAVVADGHHGVVQKADEGKERFVEGESLFPAVGLGEWLILHKNKIYI